MTQLILHPTHATPVPVTHCAPGKAKGVRKPRDITVADLRELCKARGLNATSAHTKAELRQMYASGEYVRPAAYDRQNARRKAEREARKLAAIGIGVAISNMGR